MLSNEKLILTLVRISVLYSGLSLEAQKGLQLTLASDDRGNDLPLDSQHRSSSQIVDVRIDFIHTPASLLTRQGTACTSKVSVPLTSLDPVWFSATTEAQARTSPTNLLVRLASSPPGGLTVGKLLYIMLTSALDGVN